MATKAEIAKFLAAEFPQSKVTVEAVGDASATVRHHISIAEL
ncbi:MAG: PaaI family thioesterase, partial [Rhodoferax sp.]|nr:PaaI family thioesterase [Rhodoferax sp.]